MDGLLDVKAKPIIKIQNLVARYGDDVILEDVSFQINEGEILIILGPSGCGKTTLLRHMVGLNAPYSGTVWIDGDDITACTDTVLQQVLKKIGILFQGSALFGSMTLAENLAVPVTEYTDFPAATRDNLIRMKLCQVDLGDYANFLPSEISGGMKKRAGVARALALNPKILFLDEPTAGLDPISAAELDNLILKINRINGTTIVIITHELATIFKVAHRVIMLEKSKKGIIAEGDPASLKKNSSNPLVHRFFNRQAGIESQPMEQGAENIINAFT